jgi:mRNA turnover protein 4
MSHDFRVETNTVSRLFFGKTKVMAKALGSTPESAYQNNLDKLSPYLQGNVGLLFADRQPAEILEHFQTNTSTDFARAGTVASRTFTIPAGVVYSMGGELAAADDVPLAHSLEPELRRLNVPTSLVKGKISLQNEYTVCKEGQVLDSRQTRLLKLFGVATAEFKVQVVAWWSKTSEEVTEAKSEEAMEE